MRMRAADAAFNPVPMTILDFSLLTNHNSFHTTLSVVCNRSFLINHNGSYYKRLRPQP
jgi:hypothetical protein